MTYDELVELFEATDERQAHDEFCTEASKAVDEGKDRAELPTAFLKLVLAEITVDPLRFAALRQAWNRVCDEQGMQAEKLKE